jgi:hypothetical protein
MKNYDGFPSKIILLKIIRAAMKREENGDARRNREGK